MLQAAPGGANDSIGFGLVIPAGGEECFVPHRVTLFRPIQADRRRPEDGKMIDMRAT